MWFQDHNNAPQGTLYPFSFSLHFPSLSSLLFSLSSFYVFLQFFAFKKNNDKERYIDAITLIPKSTPRDVAVDETMEKVQTPAGILLLFSPSFFLFLPPFSPFFACSLFPPSREIKLIEYKKGNHDDSTTSKLVISNVVTAAGTLVVVAAVVVAISPLILFYFTLSILFHFILFYFLSSPSFSR